jgi:hypothetical protein
MKSKGGKRPGAGRPKGRTNKDRQWLHDLLDSVGDETVKIKDGDGRMVGKNTRYKAMLRAAFEAATGAFVETKTLTGKKIVFQVEPKDGAFRTIFEQRFGRAPQTMDVTSGGEKVVPPIYQIPAFEAEK